MITLDTSAILPLLDRKDSDHERTKAAYADNGGPYLVPAGILGEVGYVAERRLGPRALDAFLEGLESGAVSLDCGEGDFPRIRALVRRYADLPLAFADASVVACAERNGGWVLALDRDFEVVAGEGTITLLPGA